MTQRVLLLVASVLLLDAAPGAAQPERFVDAVRELAVSASVDARQRAPIGPIIDRMAASLDEWDRGLAALEQRTAAADPSVPDQQAFRLQIELGVRLRQRGRFADAVRAFDAALAREPGASDVHVLRALTLDAAGDRDGATRAFHTAWTLDPENAVKAYYVVRHRGADLDRARAVVAAAYPRTLQSAIKSAPFVRLEVLRGLLSSPVVVVGDATLARGFELLAEERFNEALTALRMPPANTPSDNSPLAHFIRARRDEAENRVPDARREYDAAVPGTFFGRSVLFVGMGRLAQVDGDSGAAIDLFRRAVSLAPDDRVARRELAGAFAAGGRVDDAFVEFVMALLIDPADALTTSAVGQLLLDSGRYADAVLALRRTLQLAPDRFETHYALGAALTRLGNTEEGAREFDAYERARRQMIEQRRIDLDGGVRPQGLTGPTPAAGGPR